ncbi:MAG: DUF5053 domain-containing protein [Bacteroidales bacterium]|nr:DUF5053 domain-containing protein [Bacteroidales bacterium]
MLKLKEAIHNTDDPEELAKIELQLDELRKQNPDAFAEEILAYAKDTANRAENLVLRQKFKEVTLVISMAYIAKEYFKKSDTWIYQRVNGNIVNGKPAAFTPQEMEIMRFALNDISQKLGSLSASL